MRPRGLRDRKLPGGTSLRSCLSRAVALRADLSRAGQRFARAFRGNDG